MYQQLPFFLQFDNITTHFRSADNKQKITKLASLLNPSKHHYVTNDLQTDPQSETPCEWNRYYSLLRFSTHVRERV